MKGLHSILITLAAVLVLMGVAVFQNAPGYMDAEYYLVTGAQIAGGEGFREPFLWNYLDDPSGLPHPSHTYWMPLASLVAAAGGRLLGSTSFTHVRWLFLILAASIAPATLLLAQELGANTREAMLAGGLAIFPGFYLAFLPTSDTFGLYMLLGAAWFLACSRFFAQDTRPGKLAWAVLMGGIAGCMHLARADGIVWAAVSVLVALWSALPLRSRERSSTGVQWKTVLVEIALAGSGVGFGYALLMAPWMVRNQLVFGSPLSPGGSLGLWFLDYDDLYAYPRGLISFERWSSAGLQTILSARWWALKLNLQTAFVVQGEIFLWPLSLAGAWRLCNRPAIRWMGVIWMFTFGLMTLVFPYAGARGGFFHAGAAFQPLAWALAPLGLSYFVGLGARFRGWRAGTAFRVFGIGVFIIIALMSSFLVVSRVIGADWRSPAWNDSYRSYVQLGSDLRNIGVPEDEVVMVNNPPGFYLASGYSAIAIPNGDENVLLDAGRRYMAGYVLLEANHPAGLQDLYEHPGDRRGLEYLDDFSGTYLYKLSIP